MNKYPYGYCGMPCALCSRYRTNGKSRCLGCSDGGYYTYRCKVHDCCREKTLSQCGECAECACVRLGKMGDFSDLNTNGAKTRTCNTVAEKGFDAWYAEYAARAELLTEALARFNDGRMKRYLCELFIQKDIDVLKRIMDSVSECDGTLKENAAAFKAAVEKETGEKR